MAFFPSNFGKIQSFICLSVFTTTDDSSRFLLSQFQERGTNTKMAVKKQTKKNNIRRPRSAYNFFYKHQRSLILHEISAATSPDSPCEFHTKILNRADLLTITEQTSKSRKHRRTHGMIKLQDLTRIIAYRWREASSEIKDMYKGLFEEDVLRYKEEMKQYNQANVHTEESNVTSLHSNCSDVSGDKDTQDTLAPRPIEVMMRDPDTLCVDEVACDQFFTNVDVNYFVDILRNHE